MKKVDLFGVNLFHYTIEKSSLLIDRAYALANEFA